MELKNESIKITKKTLYRNLAILYMLNISDLIFTKFLLNKAPELFFEANILLKPIIYGNVIPYILKICFMAMILIFWYIRTKHDDLKQLKKSILISKISVMFYGVVNGIHVVNLCIYFTLK